MSGPLIDPAELDAILSDPRTVILDASWYMPADQRDPAAEYLEHRIPGARRFDFDGDIKDHGSDLPHMMPQPAEFEAAARQLGISKDSRIVVYDGAGIFAAPRAWWMFKAMGHDDVRVLNGGLPAWKEAGKPTESGPPPAPQPGDFIARPDPARIRSAADVLESLKDGPAIVDARSAGRFEGTVPEPRAGLRSGHIPGARNLPFDRLISEGRYRTPGEMAAIWSDLGLPPGPVVASCGSGVTASVLALSAEAAGRDPVAVYDGSWSEWGQDSRPDLPVETGPAR